MSSICSPSTLIDDMLRLVSGQFRCQAGIDEESGVVLVRMFDKAKSLVWTLTIAPLSFADHLSGQN
jgi:hypothetical protein